MNSDRNNWGAIKMKLRKKLAHTHFSPKSSEFFSWLICFYILFRGFLPTLLLCVNMNFYKPSIHIDSVTIKLDSYKNIKKNSCGSIFRHITTACVLIPLILYLIKYSRLRRYYLISIQQAYFRIIKRFVFIVFRCRARSSLHLKVFVSIIIFQSHAINYYDCYWQNFKWIFTPNRM